MKLKPGAIFFAKILVTESDGSMNTAFEEVHGEPEMQPVLGATVEEIEEHGGTAYVYECRAIRKVVRGKTRIIKLRK